MQQFVGTDKITVPRMRESNHIKLYDSTVHQNGPAYAGVKLSSGSTCTRSSKRSSVCGSQTAVATSRILGHATVPRMRELN